MTYFKKEKEHPAFLPGAAAAAVLSAVILLSGCSGTGTMYTPENDESSFSASTGSTSAAEYATETDAETSKPEKRKRSDPRGKKKHDPDEDPRILSADLEGLGSDLFTSETVDYYYSFSLEGTNFQLPCTYSEFSKAGWKLSLEESEAEEPKKDLIPYYSYEFYDAVPTGESGFDIFGQSDDKKKIRICLANFTDESLPPESCTVCGISVTAESGFSFLTSFKVGIGNSLKDMTSVFGTDSSIYSLTEYKDGTNVLNYRFSNGLTEGQTIPVLFEASEKSLGELMTAETGNDGSTIDKLTLYYFRVPK